MRLSRLFTETEDKSGIAAFSTATLYWRMLGALVLGIVLARWCWLLLAPHATAVAVVPEHGTMAEAGHLFGIAPVIVAPTVSTTEESVASNMKLVGVFAGRIGQPGFAVLKIDDKRQVGVVVGENIVPGTKLVEAHPDYVLVEHGGVKQRVKLVVKGAPVAVGAAPAVNGNETNEQQ